VRSNKSFTPPTTSELMVLIVIPVVIIALLPLAISLVKRRDKQIKGLSNARQIAVALENFATDHDGEFPNKEPAADYATANGLTSANKSNDAFWWLLPSYLTRENVFTLPGSAWSRTAPDNKLDTTGSAERTDTLRQGECAYLYITGLTEASNREFPMLADAGTAEDVTVYTDRLDEKGAIWRGKKAIILFVDGSGGIMDVHYRTDPAAAFVKRPGHAYNIFTRSASTFDDPWLTLGNLILGPE
jgi:type II secretory pathway pseudopilin PulG